MQVGYRQNAVVFSTAVLLAAVKASAAQAQAVPPLPPLDLGQTNILDGEGKPGALLEIISAGSIADHIADDHGDHAPGRNHQRIASLIVHPILVSNAVVAGAHPGLELLVPLAGTHNDFATGGGRHIGLGDVTVAPFLQWGPSKPHAGSLSVRIAVQAIAPTGDHDEHRMTNTGQGAWQISPYVATTWRAAERVEISGRAIYSRSGSADARTPDDTAIHVRAGQLAALNLSSSYAITDSLRAGLAGYALWQLTDPRVAGAAVPDERERVYALGPVARWETGRLTLLAAVYDEVSARNRPRGVTMNLRLQHPF